jgi:very-short-patch-repair endonuclease
MTLPEKRLWKALRIIDRGIRRQVPIGRYIVDFACLGARLVIELDGPRHDLPQAQQHDALRDAWLRSEGYAVLRFRNQEALDDLPGVVEAICATLPPRGGKGRDGGGFAEVCRSSYEAGPPPAPTRKRRARTPTLPSPLEGEGS